MTERTQKQGLLIENAVEGRPFLWSGTTLHVYNVEAVDQLLIVRQLRRHGIPLGAAIIQHTPKETQRLYFATIVAAPKCVDCGARVPNARVSGFQERCWKCDPSNSCNAWLYPGRGSCWDTKLNLPDGQQCVLDAGHSGTHVISCSTPDLVDALHIDPAALGELVLSRAKESGAALAAALRATDPIEGQVPQHVQCPSCLRPWPVHEHGEHVGKIVQHDAGTQQFSADDRYTCSITWLCPGSLATVSKWKKRVVMGAP